MMYLEIAAGASDAPALRFLSQAPSGLNANGFGELESYYKSVSCTQKNDITPAMHPLDECIIRDALGDRPAEVHYTWRPLWTMSDTQKTDNFLKKTQGVVNLVNSGLFSGEQLSIPVMNMLTEDGTLPGIEQEKVPVDIDENNPEVKEQFGNAEE
jgi:hypothetical protein